MLRCVATITLFVPKHYTLTGHGRQTHGPFHTSCIPHRGHRLSWFSLSYTAWLEVAAHIAPLSRLSCASVPPAIPSSRKSTHRQVSRPPSEPPSASSAASFQVLWGISAHLLSRSATQFFVPSPQTTLQVPLSDPSYYIASLPP